MDYAIRTRQSRYKFLDRPLTEGTANWFPDPPNADYRPTVHSALHAGWQDPWVRRKMHDPTELDTTLELEDAQLLNALAEKEALEKAEAMGGKSPGNLLKAKKSKNVVPAAPRKVLQADREWDSTLSNGAETNYYRHKDNRKYFGR